MTRIVTKSLHIQENLKNTLDWVQKLSTLARDDFTLGELCEMELAKKSLQSALSSMESRSEQIEELTCHVMRAQITAEEEAQNLTRETNQQHADDTFEKYMRICQKETPYPINYLPQSHNQQHRVLGAMIGMMIEKGVLKL